MSPWIRDESETDLAALWLLGSAALRARLAHRWTQRDLEERTRVDQSSISLFERGRFPGLRLIWFIRIANALGLDLDGLAPRHRFVDDAVLEAFRITRLEAEGKVCPSCRREL